MPVNPILTGPMSAKSRSAEGEVRRFPMQWVRVEEFLREFAKDLVRVGDYLGMVGRLPGRGLGIEIEGPAVFLEVMGVEKRWGVIGPGVATVPLLGGRQRILVVEVRAEGLNCRSVRHHEHGVESSELAVDLPAGTMERTRIERLIHEAVEESRRVAIDPEPWEEATQRHAFACQLMLGLARAGRRVVQEANNRALRGLHVFNRATDQIAARHAEDLHLQQVAEAVGLSPRHFARMLQQWSGSGFTEHMLMVRLMRARHRLTTSSDNIEGIAGEVGFGSRDHFIRAFRQYFGWTPLQFRKHWRRAAEGRENWEPVLSLPGRTAVEWLPATSLERSPAEEPGQFHTLIVSNAARDVRVLQKIASDGGTMPQGALQPGQAMFLHRDVHGAVWRVLDAHGMPVACFRTPKSRSQAMIKA